MNQVISPLKVFVYFILVFQFISCSAPKEAEEDSSIESESKDSTIEIPVDEPIAEESEKKTYSWPDLEDWDDNTPLENPVSGKLIGSSDTGQGPMRTVTVEKDGKQITFWTEVFEEQGKWEYDIWQNGFDTYKDTIIVVDYREEITRHIESIEEYLEGSSNVENENSMVLTLDDTYEGGDTPGSLQASDENGKVYNFSGDFEIEAAESTVALVGKQVLISFRHYRLLAETISMILHSMWFVKCR